MDSSSRQLQWKITLLNNLFYSAKVKPFIWTVLLFEGIKMTAFNRPNTERSKRLQIINRSDCYLEYLLGPAASRDPPVTPANSTWGRVDWWCPVSLLFPLWSLPPSLANSSVYSEGAARSRLVTFQAGQPSVTSHHYLNTNNVASHCSDH